MENILLLTNFMAIDNRDSRKIYFMKYPQILADLSVSLASNIPRGDTLDSLVGFLAFAATGCGECSTTNSKKRHGGRFGGNGWSIYKF